MWLALQVSLLLYQASRLATLFVSFDSKSRQSRSKDIPGPVQTEGNI